MKMRFISILLLSWCLAWTTPSLAFDSKKYAQVDPETREWFRGLRSPSGFPCCDTSDGTRVEDPDYMENPDGSYDVQVQGYKLHVDKDKVLTGTNRVGYAILWGRPNIGQVYCFLPGGRG